MVGAQDGSGRPPLEYTAMFLVCPSATRNKTSPVGSTSIRPWYDVVPGLGGLGTEMNCVPSNSYIETGDAKIPGLISHSTLPLGRMEAGASAMSLRPGISGPTTHVPGSLILAGGV